MEPEDIEIPEIKFKSNRTVKVSKNPNTESIVLINGYSKEVFYLPENELDEILEDIKNLR